MAEAHLRALASPDAEPRALLGACEWAEVALRPLLLQQHAGPGPAGVECAKQLAKEHGATVMALVQALGQRLAGPQHEGGHQGLVVRAACGALDALDAIRPALKVKGLELEAQRYSFIRRFLAAGAHEQALAQGWRLHAALAAHGPELAAAIPGQLAEMQLACRVNLVICTGELLGGAAAAAAAAPPGEEGAGEGADDDPGPRMLALAERAMEPVAALLQQLR